MAEWSPISLEKIKSFPLKDRASKVTIENFGEAWRPGGSLRQWLGTLPGILAGTDFVDIVNRLVRAARSEKTIILAMGAHPIKVGLNPIILDLLNRKVISGLALNGAGIIHDAELAMAGGTSEEVAVEINTGRFGMAHETGAFLNAAITEGAKKEMGLGRSVGAMLVREKFPYNRFSLLARAYQLDIPVTVHVAIGTDIIHFHPSVDGSSIGRTSHRDFRIFARMVSTLEKGVYINLGSAVILPEVFIKALSLVRNLGYRVDDFTTVNMDFFQHYRPMTNVVQRPTLKGGKGYNLVGHHEIMFPLLAAAIIEGLNDGIEDGLPASDPT